MHTKKLQSYLKVLVTFVFLLLLILPVYIEHVTGRMAGVHPDAVNTSAMQYFGFELEEISRQAGVDFIHQSPVLDPAFDHILPQIASVGASVAVSDFDNDGWKDFYVTNSRQGKNNALYHNQGNGKFTNEFFIRCG